MSSRVAKTRRDLTNTEAPADLTRVINHHWCGPSLRLGMTEFTSRSPNSGLGTSALLKRRFRGMPHSSNIRKFAQCAWNRVSAKA